MHGQVYRQHLYNLGVAVNLAWGNPGGLKSMLKSQKSVSNEDVHPMLRVSKKK